MKVIKRAGFLLFALCSVVNASDEGLVIKRVYS
jgi:hypothetical protein